MKRISPERKAATLAKLLPPYNMTVASVAQMEGISEATLYNWRNQAKTGLLTITGLGDYPDNVTILKALTPYDSWSGSEWITDDGAQKNAQVVEAQQKKASLLDEAQSTIGLWQTELQPGIIRDDDKISLIAWMKYIQVLNAVNISTAPDIGWPVKPEYCEAG